MKRKLTHISLIAAVLLSAAIPLHAWDGPFLDALQIPYSVEAAGLGGLHAAYVNGIDTLFSNPAGFRSAKPEISFGQATLSIYDSALSVIDEVLAGDPANTPLIMSRSGANLMGPLSFAYVGNGLGFGVFTDTTVRSWVWGPYPGGMTKTFQNLLFISGYAFRIPLPASWNSALDLGFSLPVYVTMKSDSSADIRGLLTSQTTLEGLVMSQPVVFAKGIGIEAGLLYSVGDVFAFGVTFRNLGYVSTTFYQSLQGFLDGGAALSTEEVPIPFDLSAGFVVNLPLSRLIPLFDRVSIMADYRNILDFLTYPPAATNPLLHIGIGLEITMLEILHLRAGLYQLLPSGGISIDLGIFTLNLAVFGRELSFEPGGYPIWGYLIGLSF